MSLDQLSVEEFMKKSPIDNNIQEILILNSLLLDQNYSSSVNYSCIPYDRFNSIDPQNCNIGKNDLDVYLCNDGSSTDYLNDISDHLALDDDLLKEFEQINHGNTKMSSKSNPIPLSSSVAIPALKKNQHSSYQIEVVNALEETYKPRYKSDYFSQDGTIRKPRYVADQLGNHFVSLKILPSCQGFIRIDWVTILHGNNIRYSMPYKFQINNDILDNSDSNPIYAPINTDISGLMKLFLVLIKSKQDELKTIKSLEIFPPVYTPSNMNNLKSMSSLTAKNLIQNYHLDKSQLAFTFCAVSPDGKSFLADWSTTVYSTVLTEISTDTSKKRKITCPKCSHSFDITLDSIDDNPNEKVIKKRKQ